MYKETTSSLVILLPKHNEQKNCQVLPYMYLTFLLSLLSNTNFRMHNATMHGSK